MLAAHPLATIAYVGARGTLVDRPETLDLAHDRVLRARSILDVVDDADRMKMVQHFLSLPPRGCGRHTVHLAAAGSPVAEVHAFDLREEHGVVAVVFTSADLDGVAPAPPEIHEEAPRLGRVRKTQLGVILDVDEPLCQMLGWVREEMVGRSSMEFIHPADRKLFYDAWIEMLVRPGPSRRTRGRHLRPDGSYLWVEVVNHNHLDDPAHGCVLADVVDVSEEMAAQESSRQRQEILDRLAEALPLGLLQVDAGRRIVYTNDRLHHILGAPRADGLTAQLATLPPEDAARVRTGFDAVLTGGQSPDIEVRVDGPDGATRHCTVAFRSLTDAGGEPDGALACVADVTEAVELRAELERRAAVDTLTDCHNRAAVMTALETVLGSAATGDGAAVMFIDIDRFKAVNDERGHAAGDAVLTALSERLRLAVRGCDLVGRVGGDEFLVVCPHVASGDEARRLADRVSRAVQGDVAAAGHRLPLRVSTGVAWTEDASVTVDRLVSEADAAMYRAKRAGGGCAALSSPPLTAA